jgi:hypothetical protein
MDNSDKDVIGVDDSVATAGRVLAHALAEAGLPELAELVLAGPSGVVLTAMTAAQGRELAALASQAGRADT